MNELNIEQFSPQKVELVTLAETYKSLIIQGIEDKAGYLAVDEARKDLKRKRVEITKTGKALREEANAFQKKVIATEKELISLIEPVEIALEEKQKTIDEAVQMEKRKASLPYRMGKILELGVDIPEEFILLMDDAKFLSFYNEKLSEKLAIEAKKLNEEKQRLEDEAKKLEEQKKIEEAKKEAREEHEKVLKAAIEQAEREKLLAVEAEKKRAEDEKLALVQEQERKEREGLMAAEAEKQALIQEQQKKERERQMAIDKEKLDTEEKKKLEAEEQIKLEKKKKYQAFLQKNDYQESNKDLFVIQNNGQTIKLFKLVDSFNL